MHPGQKQFFDFIIERTQTGKKDEMQSLLEEGFARQDNGTFTPEYLAGYTQKMLSCLEPEHVDEVKTITGQFGKTMAQ